jgi:serine/threonine protein kinase
MELLDFLWQTSSAMAFAHSRVNIIQGIAHRDLKPENIFRSGRVYKIGDFGCFFIKRENSYSVHTAGTMSYMSPQLREACIRGTPYNAFKSDVNWQRSSL